jgi:hypothetical protein
LICNQAAFEETEFHDYVDFKDARFLTSVSFLKTSFESEASFHGVGFPELNKPATKGVVLDEARFQKPIDLNWGQIDCRVDTNGRETWADLAEAFKRSSNLEGQNAAFYNQKYAEGKTHGLRRLGNFIDWVFWGYGVRFWRLTVWIALVYSMFTILYLIHPSAVTSNRAEWFGWWRRLGFALTFSLQTSVKVGYGIARARTSLYKVFAVLQSVIFKIMLICLLTVFSHISPLLNEIVGKLIPH